MPRLYDQYIFDYRNLLVKSFSVAPYLSPTLGTKPPTVLVSSSRQARSRNSSPCQWQDPLTSAIPRRPITGGPHCSVSSWVGSAALPTAPPAVADIRVPRGACQPPTGRDATPPICTREAANPARPRPIDLHVILATERTWPWQVSRSPSLSSGWKTGSPSPHFFRMENVLAGTPPLPGGKIDPATVK